MRTGHLGQHQTPDVTELMDWHVVAAEIELGVVNSVAVRSSDFNKQMKCDERK